MISRFQAKQSSAGLVARRLRSVAARADDMRPAWPAVSRRAVAGYRRAFDQQGPGWRPLAAETVRQRVRDGVGGTSPILVHTGKMRKRVMNPKIVEGKAFVRLIVEDSKMLFHQAGTKHMVARPIHLRQKDGTFMSQACSDQLVRAYLHG